MGLNRIINFYWYYIKNLKKHERKLLKYQGYGEKSIISFKENSGLKWSTIEKILKSIKILDGLELRNHLRAFYDQNKKLFDDPNTYITHFGPIGKSGALIVNQFLRCFPGSSKMIIPNSKIHLLPENSSLIFLDDFIGTGKQGLTFVKEISPSMGSSIKPYLFVICSTEDGIDYINKYKSNFIVKSQVTFKKDFYLLDNANKTLLVDEKSEIIKLNEKLGLNETSEYHLGIPFAFYYSTPDNSLGILWNDKTKYKDKFNNDQKWYGLLPRSY